jgi:hypothetical protein
MCGVGNSKNTRLLNRCIYLFSLRKIRSFRLPLTALVAAVWFCVVSAGAQVNVTTYHNDIGRTGQNLNETTLNLSNVNATLFGKLFSQPTDGQAYAQPLYLSGIMVNGAVHNVVFVATEHDSVYAFDADTNGGTNSAPLWQASMLVTAHGAAAGATTVSSKLVGADITPEIGITGTPVIDPASGTLYVVSKTMEGTTAVQRLHALDVTTGAEKFGGPTVLTATVPGTGNGSVNGSLTFDPLWENQRPGLLLLNGIVYIGFSSHVDNGPWHGWILGYNATTLQQTGAYCVSPNGTGGGVWMSGNGLPADQLDPVNKPFGRMFIPTGNGDYNATLPYTNSMDYGDSHLALDLTNGVPSVTDEFTTNQQSALNSEDEDVASGGLIVLPTQTTGNFPHLAVQAGKAGTLYLLNRDNLGGYNLTANQDVQEQGFAVGNVGVWSTPAYWNGNVYYWGRFDNLKSIPLANGLLSTTPTKSTEQYGYPGSTPSISANGTSQGIVWSIDSENYFDNGPGLLQAHDASNVATTLYSSATNAGRDAPGPAVKFTVPTVANGKVYVGAGGEVDFYGLLNGLTQTSSPVIAPGTEAYSGALTVTITDSTPGAAIYYTTDGTSATTNSTLYTGPITVTATETIKAIASANGLLLSAQTAATYTNVSEATAVIFSLPTGTYGSAQTVTLSDATANSTIYYTTDGTTPTAASTVYTAPISVGSTETITAVAGAPGLSLSPVIAQTYTIILGQTGISFSQGFGASAGLLQLNGSVALNDTRLQLTNGLSGEAASAWFHTPVNIQTFTTDFTFQLSNPMADGMTFAIQNGPQAQYAMGGNGFELGYEPMPNSMAIKFDLYDSAGEGPDSTGLYVNGAAPTVPAINLTGTGIDLHSDDTMAVHLTYDGTTLTMTITDQVTSASWSTSWTINIPGTIGSNTAYVGFTGATGGLASSQKVLTWTFFSSTTATTTATPSFTPAAGTYTAAQAVTISDATSAARIYYTTDGSTPSTSSAVYLSPITLNATETIRAVAAVAGSSVSAAASALYTISSTPQAATPAFAPAAGTYSTSQTVTIGDTTAGATIYYTTNGATPTTSSAVYAGPLTVSATETIKAMAVVSGDTNSAIGSATYTIAPPAATPSFSPAAGTYSSAQAVTISDTTPGATIYYTTNGSAPTTSSTVYTGPLSVGSTETIKAIAIATGFSTSAPATAAYTINIVLPAATPTFSPVAGTYTSAQTVTISDTTSGAVIYYTTDGTIPTTSSIVYAGPVTVSATETINAIALATGSSASAVGTAGYTITAAAPAVNFSSGFTATGLNLLGAKIVGSALQLTDGAAGEARSAWFTTRVNVQSFTTDFNFQDTSATADGFTFTIQAAPAGIWANGGNGASLGYGGIASSVAVKFDLYSNAGEGSDSTGFYTNGATPTVPAVDMTSSGVNLHSGDVMHAHVTYDGTTLTLTLTDTVTGASFTTATAVNIPTIVGANTAYVGFTAATGGAAAIQSILNWTYIVGAGTPSAATPIFSPAAGSYTSAQAVTLSDATAGATIYYTTNGSTPTTSSTVYAGPIPVSATETVKAIATASGFSASPVGNAAYTITLPTAATPTFSPAGGSYSSAQTVTIGDTTSGVTIYYTTNGTVPTTSSTIYTGAITVGATETLNAIAVANGFTSSATGTAAYTISLPVAATPAFTPAAGTYASAQTVTIGDTTPGATIYYTTTGSTPTTSSVVYTGPVPLSASETLSAIAVATGYTNSAPQSAVYTITLPVAATPVFSPAAGTFTTAQAITISDTTPGATIYYTTNGSTPTTSSTLYSGPVAVSVSETVKAIAVASGFTNSAVGSASYSITPLAAATPLFSPAAGTYASAQSVTISDTTAGSTIYYTTNGTAPTTASTVYSGPITVSATETLNAIAVASGFATSPTGTAAYTISSAAPAVNFGSGFTATGLNLLGSTITGGALQLTDGAAGEQRAAWFTKKVNVQKFTTDFNFQATSAVADGFTFTVQNSAPGVWAVGGNGASLGYGGIGTSVAIKFDLYNNAGEGLDSTGIYTNGATPTVPSVDMTASGVNLHSGDLMHAHVTYDGTTLTLTITDTVTGAAFTTSTAVNIPTIVGGATAYIGFTGGTGGAAAVQNVLNWTYTVN